MALLPGWNQQDSGDIVRVAGKVGVLGPKNAVLEVSLDEGINWVIAYDYPNKGELYLLELPAQADIRVTSTPAADWYHSNYNEMSG